METCFTRSDIPGESIPEFLIRRAGASPNAAAFRSRLEEGEWRAVTWGAFLQEVRALAGELSARGLAPGDQVGIVMENSAAWELAQHALFLSGAVVVGLDGSDPGERLRKILALSDIKALFVDATARMDRFPRDFLRSLKFIAEKSIHRGDPGAPVPDYRFSFTRDRRSAPASPPVPGGEAPATILFTSGTTGDPKAIAYSHGQLALATRAIVRRAPSMPEQARSICWLPLASPFQRIINFCCIVGNWQSFIVPAPSEIMARLGEIHPHFFAAVPRFYEKVFEGFERELKGAPRWKRRLVRSAMRFGLTFRAVERNGERPGLFLSLRYALAKLLVFNKFRGLAGRDIRFLLSGSAPMNPGLLEKFHALGWLILESYGVSENIVPISMNTPDRFRLGSVGRPLPGNRIKISNRGAVLMKGPGVSSSVAGTDRDGFVDTGDIGEIDDQGFLWLRGRGADVFKLSTGRKIIPAGIEAALNGLDLVEHGVAMGENRKCVTALLNIDPDRWADLVKERGSTTAAKQFLTRETARACRHLPAYARPVKIMVSLVRFSIRSGELTGNLKLRRKFVIEKHGRAAGDSSFFL